MNWPNRYALSALAGLAAGAPVAHYTFIVAGFLVGLFVFMAVNNWLWGRRHHG